MNKTYRLIWSEITRSWVVVSELTCARGKRAAAPIRRTVGALFILLGSGSIAFAATPASTQLPTGGQIVAGSGSISQSGANMTVTQTSDRMAANWSGFDIGSQASVTFHQPSSSSIALNRVLSQSPTQIMGHLNANGQVVIVNPAGIVFGKGSQVNVGAITASTLGITDKDFMAGNYTFANGGHAGSIDNQGRITTAEGGIVALIAPVVTNEGSISTPKGGTLLAAGDQIVVDFTGDGLIGYQMKAGTARALAQNSGDITADGGLVVLTAKAADALSQAVVNNTGILRAQTLASRGGHILLLSDMQSGTTEVGGTLDASAPAAPNPGGGDGGAIETSGHEVEVADNTTITTQAADGNSGSWRLDPYDFTIAASGGDITGSAFSTALGNGNVTIQTTNAAVSCTGVNGCGPGSGAGKGDIFVDDTVNWGANTLTLSAYRNIDINAEMDASGTAGLALKYGQGAAASGNTASYNVHAPVNLGANTSFSTTLGSNGTAVNWTVIDSLGSPLSTTGNDLQGINGGLGGHYVLGTSIDASPTSTNSAWKGYGGFRPIGNITTPFTGTFDGLGHTIRNLYINRPGTNYVGLFGATSNSALRNVGLVGGSVSGSAFVGGLVGGNLFGTITDAYATGSVGGSGFVGGLVGDSLYGTITNAYATGRVSGSTYVGGLAGGYSHGTITDAYAAGRVTGSTSVGGLVGSNHGGTITDAYATGSVSGSYGGGLMGFNHHGTITDAYATGSVSGRNDVGGLVGGNSGGTVTDAYAAGSVTGSTSVGGLMGGNHGGTVTNTYATGRVTGSTSVGGLVGSNHGGTITDAYATGSVSGSTNVGGLVGISTNSINSNSTITNGYWDIDTSGTPPGVGSGTTTGVTGLTTAALASSLPAGFSSSTWGNGGGKTTPYLLANASFATVSGSVYLGSDTGAAPTAYGVILNMTQLQNINSTGLGNSYVLGTDLSDTVTTGAGFTPIGNATTPFTGTFDGLGYTITNLYINRPGANYVGLFGKTSNSTLRSVGLVGGSVRGGVGVGGLVGFSTNSTITDAYATGSVSGSGSVGGLAGGNAYGTITDAYATGSVSGSGNVVGGLVGDSLYGTITNAYATGRVSGSTYVGGLAGGYSHGTITDAYAAGRVTGSGFVGGLVGVNSGGTVSNSFYDSAITGQSDTGKGTPEPSLTMKTRATYINAGWDFTSVWAISATQNSGYPVLQFHPSDERIWSTNSGSTNSGKLLNTTVTRGGGTNRGDSLNSPPLVSFGSNGADGAGSSRVKPEGNLLLGGGLGSFALRLSESGAATTLVMDSAGPGGAKLQTASLPLFTQTGGKIAPSGRVNLIEQGRTLEVARSAQGAVPIPKVNEAAMRFATATYRSADVESIRVAVGISKDGILLIRVPPAMKARLDTNRIVLIGMQVAKARLGVDPVRVNGVVLKMG